MKTITELEGEFQPQCHHMTLSWSPMVSDSGWLKIEIDGLTVWVDMRASVINEVRAALVDVVAGVAAKLQQAQKCVECDATVIRRDIVRSRWTPVLQRGRPTEKFGDWRCPMCTNLYLRQIESMQAAQYAHCATGPSDD